MECWSISMPIAARLLSPEDFLGSLASVFFRVFQAFKQAHDESSCFICTVSNRFGIRNGFLVLCTLKPCFVEIGCYFTLFNTNNGKLLFSYD